MFSLCDNMKWSHLPAAGGLYDQDPVLLERFRVIFQKRAEHELEQQKQREKEQQQKSKTRTRSPRRR